MSVASRTGGKISHYEVHELLGSGGMGEVYRCTDLRLARRVALKFLRPLADPLMQSQLIKEAQAASQLDHPNICTIFEVDETPAGEVFIAMAFYEGETLDRVLGRGPLGIGRALSIAVQTGRGLAAAHEQLIVHRDIKPANLMITLDDTVKILDFGIAKMLGDVGNDRGSVVGTPAYMSPEQLCGEPVDARSDIWSLGTVLYQMVTGVAPFGVDSVATVVASVLNDEPTAASKLRTGVSPLIENILVKALAKNRQLRYERIDVMVRELIEMQATLDSGSITRRFPTATAGPSIAVLPFQDMTAAKDQEFLCDGIAEEILRALSRIPDLHVASRTSAFQFKHHAPDIREIGARLNVSTILEGSVRRVDDRVRISAQLVSVKDGYRLWCDRYDREMKDIFAVEDEIADQIAQALRVALTSRTAPPAVGPALIDAQAYEVYLQGRQFIHQHRRKAFEIALQLFSQAIEINPRYARAYAGIADCHSFLRLYFGKGQESATAADEASAKALELEPELADAHAARGLALFLRGEFEQAEFHLRRAIELDPYLYEPHYISGRLHFSQGSAAKAAEHFKEACAIVPEAYDSWYLLGMCYKRMGKLSKARSADLECIEAVKARVRWHPDDTRALTMGASVLVEMGEPERAEKWIKSALAVDSEEPIIEYNAACVYIALGQFEDALGCLQASMGQGGLSKDWATNDPDLDPLRDDPRFQRLLDAVSE
ncbi:MAG TPA: protein kinase [Blastocatellia bacterium]|nr:protein kinase [Blastocatellia bacterium]